MTATKTQKTKTGIDIEGILADVEQLEKQLPPSESEVRERREHLAGQIRHAKEQAAAFEGNRRLPEAKRAAEVEKWKSAVEKYQSELDNTPAFSMQVRRQAALDVIAHEDDLKAAKASIADRWAQLVDCQLKRCLGVDDYVEYEAVSKTVTRLNAGLRLAARLKSEIAQMIPRELLDERAGLEELLAASANLRTGPATSDAVHRAREWASDELKRLNDAAVSLSWTELESYTVNPL